MEYTNSAGLGPNSPDAGNPYTPITLLDNEQDSKLKQLSQLELFWVRFRANKLSIVGLAVVLMLILMAIFAPLITPGVTPEDNFIGVLPFGQNGPSLAHFPAFVFGNTAPDNLQRSVLTEVTYGARVSLFIGISAALLASIIGTIVGAISGYFSGWIDNLIMRITDIFLTIPFLPLVIAISAIYSQGTGNVVVIIAVFAFTGWAGLARLVRAQFLTLRESEYAEAARAVGVNNFRLIFRHLLPNALTPVIVATTLGVAGTIIGESTLDFLGVGVQFPPTATWGNILALSQNAITSGNWWWPLFPGVFIVITVLAINFVGDGLRDALDVRTRVE